MKRPALSQDIEPSSWHLEDGAGTLTLELRGSKDMRRRSKRAHRRKRRTAPNVHAHPKTTSCTVRAVERAMLILSAVAASKQGITLTDLARVANLPRSTTHRLLTTLQSERYVSFDAESRSRTIGRQAQVIASACAEPNSQADVEL